jgi:poly-beta-1,6-N-acetyl-D-glucosamine synthase
MRVWEYIFWVSCFIVFYNYIGYGIIIYFINALKKKKNQLSEVNEDFFPTVSFIVAAFDEEDCIQQKIINSLEQNYPSEQIEFIFITDGSTDKTPHLILRHPSIQLLHIPERKGKSAALNRAVLAAKNDILIFSDANTLLNNDATRNIARHYRDQKVGGVAGEKKVINLSSNSHEVGDSEGAYWKYESFLKKLDSEFYSVVGAAGELFSVRRRFYESISYAVILDDFVISMKVAQKGYRIVYEPGAYAMELPSFSMQDEQKRKIRIAAGGFQAIAMLGSLLLFWKQPRLSFLYISHRVLRWTLSPLCLVLAFISNFILFLAYYNFLYAALFIAQLCFCLLAVVSSFVPFRNNRLKILKLPYYFVFMNLSVFQGFFRFLRGKQPATWEKAKRTQPALQAE